MTAPLIAGALLALPALASANGGQRTSAPAPSGWTQHQTTEGLEYFLPPGASNMDVYEAIFPTQAMNGSLEDTASAIWHAVVAGERVVDSKGKRLQVTDGAPAYEVLVASIDARNQGVYRVFVVKQYGSNVAAGELRFNDVERIEAIGKSAVASLENMSAAYQSSEITPYHATLITPAPRGGSDVSNEHGGFPAGLAGMWVLKVPGVAYTTTADYGAYTESTLHVSPGAASGYLRITAGRRYVWYGGDGKAMSSGSLVRVIPRRDARPGVSYWRVFEGGEEHYLSLDGEGGISIYDPATNMVSMEGTKR